MSQTAKTPMIRLIPLLVRGVAPAAAVTIGLMPTTTVSAPGDLDPTFGDFGRVGPMIDFSGPAWSTETTNGDQTLFAGGDECQGYYCSYFNAAPLSEFMGALASDGSVVADFVADQVAEFQIINTASQADGSIFAVGRSRENGQTKMTVAKFKSSGQLDESFAQKGVFRLSADGLAAHTGTSVAVDPDGRIVIAGSQMDPDALLVVRLHTNGAIDESFGSSGVYNGPSQGFVDYGINVVGTTSGYRVNTTECKLIGLTSAGKLDTTFGTGGIVEFAPVKDVRFCNSLVEQPDGGLLVGGAAGDHGFAARLLADGTQDNTFSGSAIEAGVTSVTAMTVAGYGSGSIVVAGYDPAGTGDAVIMGLHSTGALDGTYGHAGTTLIDLPSDMAGNLVIRDLAWRADGTVTAVGGDYIDYWTKHPFVVRLQGSGGTDAAGVIGAVQANLTTNEQSNEVVATFRRTGGAAGVVSVAYHTETGTLDGTPVARAGEDFGSVSGRLTWNDGDIAPQEIHVPIIADSKTEEPEYFRVTLTDPQGGAGLGTRAATVEIQPDGSPHGQFEVGIDRNGVEGMFANMWVTRNYYTSGAVSVTVTPSSGSASAGSDFDPTPTTVSWEDGEGGAKYVPIKINLDTESEPVENFTVSLSNPTGGALLGPRSTTTVNISAAPPPPPSSSGGGGPFGLCGLLILAAARILKSSCQSIAKHVGRPAAAVRLGP